MRFRPTHLMTLTFGVSLMGLALIVVALFGANLAPLIEALPLSQAQKDTLTEILPSEPISWPWQRGGILASVTILPPDTDRAYIELLPRITTGPGGKATLTEGTGFFVSDDGTILTAGHLLKDCSTIRVKSRFVASAPATRIAADPAIDVAIIRAAIIAPAVLGLGALPAGSAQLMVFGYPADGDPLLATEVRGSLWHDVDSSKVENPLQLLRIDAEKVRAGFSGSPVLSRDGDVIGMIRGGIPITAPGAAETTKLSGIVLGPGSGAMTAFMGRVAPLLKMVDIKARHASANDPRETALKAVVHVTCGR